MPTPLVSVIIPVYNAEKFLPRALASAQAQTLKDIEFIIIDDQSTDGTLKLAQKLAKSDARIRVFQQEKNGGPSAARNRGLKEAKGTWIALLDDDDSYHPERLKTMLAEAEAQGADIIFDNLEMYDISADELMGIAIPASMLSSGFITLADYMKFNSPFHRGVKLANLKAVFKRSIITTHNLKYSEAYRYGEDLMFYMELILTGAKTYYTDKPYYTYTMQVGKKSGQKSPFTRSVYDSGQLIRATEDVIESWKNRITPTALAALRKRLKELHQFATYNATRQMLKEGHRAEGIKNLIQNPKLVLWALRQAMYKSFEKLGATSR